MMPTTCPDRDVLAAYVLGRLAEDELSQTADHASGCELCQSTLAELDQLTDPLIERIRRPRQETILTPSATVALRPAEAPGELGRLGAYRILALLGQGGMGMVYHGEDIRLGRAVALKVMHPRYAQDDSAKARFLREARAVAALRSDHVVAVYQVDEDNHVAYLAMELLQGESLADRLRRVGKIPWRTVAVVGAQIAEGLAAAHATGIIHRDVKPANVWLESPHDRVKLLDFGLARPTTNASQTTDGLILGTPHYLAPEQAARESLDGRADLYSLGVVLYRACAGVLPLGEGKSDAMAVLNELATKRPTSLHALCPEVPTAMTALVAALLEKDAANRPNNARQVADELRRIASLPEPRRRNPLWFRLMLGLMLGLGFLALGMLWPWWGHVADVADPSVRELTLLEADYHFLRFSGDGKRLATASFTDDDRLVAVWEFPSLRRIAPLTGWEPDDRRLSAYADQNKYQVLNGAFSIDGKHLALAIGSTGDNDFALWNVEKPDQPFLLRHGKENVHALAFRRDGRQLASGGVRDEQTSIRFWDVATGELAQTTTPRERRRWINGLAYSVEGDPLYAGFLNARGIDLIDRNSGRRLKTIGKFRDGVVRPGLTLSDDGMTLAVPTRDYRIHVLEVATGKTLLTVNTTVEAFWGYALSGDGKRLAVPNEDDTSVLVWDVLTKEVLYTITPKGTPPRTRGLALSPDGRWLVTVGVAGLAQIWEIDRLKK